MQTPQNATIFEFLEHRFNFESGEAVFRYQVHFEGGDPLEFKEVVTVGDAHRAKKLPEVFLENMLTDLHLVLGMSYYKLFCPAKLAGYMPLSESQADFWNTVYKKGLGEFLYRNNLSPSIIAQFEGAQVVREVVSVPFTERNVLVGIGGGKDSIVSLELLKGYERTGFVVETGKGHDITDEVAEIAGVSLLKMKRTLDAQLLAGVPQSYNGHVPVSAMYAFLGIFEAALGARAYFVVSNEYSSNFGNVVHEGLEVNHKWSGSVEFETLFQNYVRENLSPSISYFSLTRPFYELRVMELFVKLGSPYFKAFSSCNRNFTHTHNGENRWCGECPKCAFTFLMLSAFLPQEEVISIFKKDLFEDQALLPLYKDLLGLGALKPFDCVGTFEESQVALMRAKESRGDSFIVQTIAPFLENVKLSDEVFKVQKANTVPSCFRLLGMESALLLGYGKENHAAEAYLKATYPNLRLGIADQAEGANYLGEQDAYDVVVKTPSIPHNKVVRQSVTATQLFFAEVPHANIIGVTGSKGKSTTSSLIYLMLKKVGKNVRLVGNIGVPALQELMERPFQKDELVVFELSSYQLEDLDVSPHIAVVTSLFPEHLDHHGSLEEYYAAKRTITNFQEAQDVFVYASGFPLLEGWGEATNAHVVIQEALPFAIENPDLRGDHMRGNVELAYTVGLQFGVTITDAQEVINTFVGLPHRLQHIGTHQQIDFYDDSISTTPESTIAGIRALGNVDTIILGGVDRGYVFGELEKELRDKGVRNVVLFPESGEHMLASEDGFTVLHTSSMEEAVQFAYKHTAPRTTCLLSPSAPSYNLFTNFEARGEAFKNAVDKFAS